jgi:hypothetical protein
MGAVSYYVDHFVTGRISKFTYGVFGDPVFNSSDPEHVRRANASYVNAMGDRRVPGRFYTMLPRVRHAQSLLGVSDLIPLFFRAPKF